MSFWEMTRNQIQQFLTKRTANAESDNKVDDTITAVFDQRDMRDRPAIKWYDPKKITSKKIGICFHHTDVYKGFGVHKDTMALYMKAPMEYSNFIVKPPAMTHDEWARVQSIASRYRGGHSSKYGVPYHAVFGPNDVLYLNLPFEWITWHGNRSNHDYLGFAWDADSRKESVGPRKKNLMASIRLLIRRARLEGHDIQKLTVHSAWANKGGVDPGSEFIHEIMMPLAKEFSLTMDMSFKDNKRGAISMHDNLLRDGYDVEGT